jgi:hypothetical protein
MRRSDRHAEARTCARLDLVSTPYYATSYTHHSRAVPHLERQPARLRIRREPSHRHAGVGDGAFERRRPGLRE